MSRSLKNLFAIHLGQNPRQSFAEFVCITELDAGFVLRLVYLQGLICGIVSHIMIDAILLIEIIKLNYCDNRLNSLIKHMNRLIL